MTFLYFASLLGVGIFIGLLLTFIALYLGWRLLQRSKGWNFNPARVMGSWPIVTGDRELSWHTPIPLPPSAYAVQ